ncbi:cytochrome c oxidase cbb3-type subunit 3 [Chitinophaga eiseniae]|uniref:Cytochrome c oxidase cbb3-type subunit 3 n=1 Tax=Chitinophaga eiseniae TaxID=634771 RepID=A0A1T4RHU6_9BACT|nr:cbb3-type cytochrome c oxidase N-terminal domain-containing protein [Chitinophaga eiseniae]SKA15376.1 cytochrome c oxidase cbb3-type subunit 3 [Chitinophaga eiseniae]
MKRKLLYTLSGSLLCSLSALANGPKPPSELKDPVALVLLTVIIGLVLVIAILGNAVVGAMDLYRERMKREAAKLPAILMLVTLSLAASLPASATTAATEASSYYTPLSRSSLYLLVTIVVLEIAVIISLLFVLRFLAGIKSKRKRLAAADAATPAKPRISWLEKINKTRTLDATSETEEDMGHDFDGIRELNNPTPPWWKWGFIFSICFGVVYFWRTEISHSAPNQLQELAMAEEKAAVAKAEYLKNAANNIDENNVKMMDNADDLAAGGKIFVASCAPCHGPQGQGVVGPNLTDDYWMHGGKINEVFKTIKYGVPDKGMKAWQEDFSPKQLAQLASYVKSIHGSNPPNPKEPQGVKE